MNAAEQLCAAAANLLAEFIADLPETGRHELHRAVFLDGVQLAILIRIMPEDMQTVSIVVGDEVLAMLAIEAGPPVTLQ